MLAVLELPLIGYLLLSKVDCICTPQVDVSLFRCNYLRLTDVPSIIHRNTLDLDLSHNLIEVLHEDSFSRLVSLRKLSMNHNRIYKITERAFLPLGRTLEFLDLRNNQLISNRVSPFPTAALTSLTKLKHLDLSGNPIGFIPSGFLSNMGASLVRLDLAASTLKIHIEARAFHGLAKLHYLNLAHNTFAELDKHSFDGLRPEYFSQFSLEGVQWDCDCRLLWFRRWLTLVPRKAMFTDSHPGGECVTPPKFKGHSLLHLNTTDLQCAPQLVSTVPPGGELDPLNPIQVVGFHGYNLTLSCTFISEPKMQVEWYQNGVLVQPHWKRITQMTNTGTKFTTTLHFNRLESELDMGLYRCQTANQKGVAAANFLLSVESGLTNRISTNPRVKGSNLPESPALGKYVLIVGIIMATNVIFVIVAVITYHCIRSKKNPRNKLIPRPECRDTPEEPCFNVTTRNPVSGINALSNHLSIIQNPCASTLNEVIPSIPMYMGNKVCVQHEYASLGPAMNLHNIQPSGPKTPYTHRLADSSQLIHSPPITRVSSPSRLSSELGYSASVSTQPGELSSLIYGQTEIAESFSPNSSKTPNKSPYYTLAVHRGDGHLPGALVYISGKAEQQKIVSNMSRPVVNPLGLTGSMFVSHAQEDTSSSGSERLTDDLELLCPVHGLQPESASNPISRKSSQLCIVHTKPNHTDPTCPVHGTSRSTKASRVGYNTLPLHKPSCPAYNRNPWRNRSSIPNISSSDRVTNNYQPFPHSSRGNTLPR